MLKVKLNVILHKDMIWCSTLNCITGFSINTNNDRIPKFCPNCGTKLWSIE